jgi:hypothetical protein
MNQSFLLKSAAAIVILASAALLAPSGARAQMSIFSMENVAQLHCPGDEVVWLDVKKRRYYTRGQRLYARGRDGVYVCRKEAKRSMYKKSRLGLR